MSQRLVHLPDAARRLAEVIAVAARPLPIAVVAQAAGIADGAYEALALARTQRLARNGVRDGQEVVEPVHDRFRQAVLARLERGALREYHARLADTLETSRVDSEAIAVHHLAAGRRERAAWHSERAAEEAAAKMAFDQAVRLFRFTLENSPASGEHARRLRTRLAQVLEWSGRGEEAGRAYLEAAAGATPSSAELERAASVGFFSSGHIVEGAAALRRALATAGLKKRRSPRWARGSSSSPIGCGCSGRFSSASALGSASPKPSPPRTACASTCCSRPPSASESRTSCSADASRKPQLSARATSRGWITGPAGGHPGVEQSREREGGQGGARARRAHDAIVLRMESDSPAGTEIPSSSREALRQGRCFWELC